MSIEGLLKIELTPQRSQEVTDDTVLGIAPQESLEACQVSEAVAILVNKLLNSKQNTDVNLPESLQSLKSKIEQSLSAQITDSKEGQVIELSDETLKNIVAYNKLVDYYKAISTESAKIKAEKGMLDREVLRLSAENAGLQNEIHRSRSASDLYDRNAAEITDNISKVQKREKRLMDFTILLERLHPANIADIEARLKALGLKFESSSHSRGKVKNVLIQVPELPAPVTASTFEAAQPDLSPESLPTVTNSTAESNHLNDLRIYTFKGITLAVSFAALSFLVSEGINRYAESRFSTPPEAAASSATPTETSFLPNYVTTDTRYTNVSPESLEGASANFSRLVGYYNSVGSELLESILVEIAFQLATSIQDLDTREHEITLSIQNPQNLQLPITAQAFDVDWSSFTYSVTLNPQTLDYTLRIIDGDYFESVHRVEIDGTFQRARY